MICMKNCAHILKRPENMPCVFHCFDVGMSTGLNLSSLWIQRSFIWSHLILFFIAFHRFVIGSLGPRMFVIICFHCCQASLSAFISSYSLQNTCGIMAWVDLYTHTNKLLLDAQSHYHSHLSLFLSCPFY